jgi:hypothetical protein
VEDPTLSVFENRMLRGMFGTERGEVTGEWRKLRNQELCSPNGILRIVPRNGKCSGCVGRGGGLLLVLADKYGRNRPPVSTRFR